MRKPIRIVASAVITVGCALMVALVASQIMMTYYLPPTGPGAEATEHATTFGPAVVGTVLTVLLTALSIGWLVWNLVRRPPARLWGVAVLLLIGAVVTALSVGEMSRPTF